MTTIEGSERERRLAQNQALYRRVNESLEELNTSFSFVTPYPDFVCECANTGCNEPIQLDLKEYESIRANPLRFAVYPDPSHVYPDVETTVEHNDRYWVVEKQRTGAEVAKELDTRS